MNEVFKPEYEHKTETFVFPEVTPEEEDKLAAAEKKVEEACESFAKALDSTAPWLTKELLDIYEQLEKILWVKEKTEEKKENKKEWVEKTVLWSMSFKLLYEKHKDVIPEKLRDIFAKMLDELSMYENTKLKNKQLKEMLRSCASIVSVQSAIQVGGGRTFMPDNLGNQNWA